MLELNGKKAEVVKQGQLEEAKEAYNAEVMRITHHFEQLERVTTKEYQEVLRLMSELVEEYDTKQKEMENVVRKATAHTIPVHQKQVNKLEATKVCRTIS